MRVNWVWLSGLIVYISAYVGAAGILIGLINSYQALTLFGSDGAFLDTAYLVFNYDYFFSVPVIIASFVVGRWTMKNSKKVQTLKDD